MCISFLCLINCLTLMENWGRGGGGVELRCNSTHSSTLHWLKKGGPLFVSVGLHCRKELPRLMWAPRTVRRFGAKKKFLVCVVNQKLSILSLVTMPTGYLFAQVVFSVALLFAIGPATSLLRIEDCGCPPCTVQYMRLCY